MQRLADELWACARHHRLPGVAHDPQDYGLLVVRVGPVRVRVGFAGVLLLEIPRDEVDWLRLATVLRDLALAVERAFAEPPPLRQGN